MSVEENVKAFLRDELPRPVFFRAVGGRGFEIQGRGRWELDDSTFLRKVQGDSSR